MVWHPNLHTCPHGHVLTPPRCLNVTLQVLYPTKDTRRLMPLYHVWAWSLCVVVLVTMLVHHPYGLVVLGRKSLPCTLPLSFHAHGRDLYILFVHAAYKFCWQQDLSLHNYAMAIPFAVVLVQLILALVSIVVVYVRLRALSGQPAATAVLVRHVSYVIIFFCVWLAQVNP